MIPVGKIDYVEAQDDYVCYRTEGKGFLKQQTMADAEASLDPARFIRIHRSAIVRLGLVDTLLRGAGGDYEVQLKSGLRLPVSRSRREELERRLGVMP